MKLKSKILKIHPDDNVIVALVDLFKGDEMINETCSFVLISDVKAKHKFSTQDLKIGDEIYMYGVIVGKAKKEIAIGEVIDTQNIIHETEKYSVPKTNQKINWVGPKIDAYTKKTFLGYHRENGSVGTENNWLVIPLVFCQNRNIETLKNTILKGLGYENSSKQSYDLKELIHKYKTGATESELMQVDVITNNNNKKQKKHPISKYRWDSFFNS
jgi:altronate hydrolase